MFLRINVYAKLGKPFLGAVKLQKYEFISLKMASIKVLPFSTSAEKNFTKS